MIGRWSADLIKASGQRAAPIGRMDGSSQDRAATRRKPLPSGRRPWMDQPKEELMAQRLMFAYRGTGVRTERGHRAPRPGRFRRAHRAPKPVRISAQPQGHRSQAAFQRVRRAPKPVRISARPQGHRGQAAFSAATRAPQPAPAFQRGHRAPRPAPAFSARPRGHRGQAVFRRGRRGAFQRSDSPRGQTAFQRDYGAPTPAGISMTEKRTADQVRGRS